MIQTDGFLDQYILLTTCLTSKFSDQGIRKRWMQGFLPEKAPSIFSCLDLILWPNVSNIFGDNFVPHHLVFYEIF